VDRGVPVRLDVLGGDVERPADESPEVRRVLWEIGDLGLADRVRLVGTVGPPAIRDHLHAGDVLLHSSVTEGLPTAVLEAMATALPVVVTDAGGTREAVTDGREGLVVPPRDPEALAGAVERLWSDPALRVAMGEAGRRRAVADFTLDAQVRSFAAMYEALAERRAA
jgi:glycosyltransferase involved in cell wall biosynthesis